MIRCELCGFFAFNQSSSVGCKRIFRTPSMGLAGRLWSGCRGLTRLALLDARSGGECN